MSERFRQLLPLVAWVAALSVAVVTFTAMGAGQLAAPALTDPGSWAGWADGRDPVVATAALLRLVVLALAWYLLGVTIIGVVARVVRVAAMIRVADALSLPVVRRVLQSSLGVGLVAAVAVSSAAPANLRAGPDPVLAGAAQDAQEMDAPAPPRMRPLPPREASAVTPPPREDRTAAPVAPTPTTPSADTTPPDVQPSDVQPTTETHEAATVTVRPGDHLWSIAADHLGAHADQPPSDDQVAAHWRRLIDANRDRLVDPANPDLILPGQQFVLPSLTDSEERT